MKNMAIKFQIQFEFENDRNIRVDLDLNKLKNSSLGNYHIKFTQVDRLYGKGLKPLKFIVIS